MLFGLVLIGILLFFVCFAQSCYNFLFRLITDKNIIECEYGQYFIDKYGRVFEYDEYYDFYHDNYGDFAAKNIKPAVYPNK